MFAAGLGFRAASRLSCSALSRTAQNTSGESRGPSGGGRRIAVTGEDKGTLGYTMNKHGGGAGLNERGQSLIDATYRSLDYHTNASGSWALPSPGTVQAPALLARQPAGVHLLDPGERIAERRAITRLHLAGSGLVISFGQQRADVISVVLGWLRRR
jgi:hypothetical protein